MSALDNNPYVGPRTFTEAQRHLFFGREREARDLLSLVMSERVVLFYAQSGAGKSSLINTRLRPGLRQEGFEVLPMGRVSGSLPEGITEVDNIFVFNLLLKLDQNRREAAALTQTPLTAYLQQYQAETSQTKATAWVLIIDQFEELLTTNLPHWEERGDFFSQLRQAMLDDPRLWVVLSMREDYVASLDPYARFLPGKLETRFYMQRLSAKAALEAVKNPAEKGGRPFAPGVAETLVDNLRQIRLQGQETGSHIGEFVEPVQLQVVCFQLWEKLKGRPLAEISERDVLELGDVDTALAQFYEQAVAETVQQTGIPELDLRDWFERELITEAGTRGLVYQGKEQTGGLANETVESLVSKFLLRADVRAGGAWYELVHDRLVGPILKANHAWRLKQPLIQVAQEWAGSNRNPELLLDGQPLTAALSGNWQALGPLVKEFLEASQAAQKAKDEALQAEKEAQRQRELEQAQALAEEQRQRAGEQARAAAKLRKRAVALAGVGVVAIVMAITAAGFSLQSNQNAEVAATSAYGAGIRATEAYSAQTIAEAASTDAIIQQQTAEAAQVDAANSAATALASEGAAQAEALKARQAEATSRAELMAAVEARADLEKSIVALLTAQAPTPTAMPTTLPTATPTGLFTPGPTVAPLNSPTPTPNETAIAATIEALQTQLAQVRGTQTAVASIPTRSVPLLPQPTSTPTAVPLPSGQIAFVSNRGDDFNRLYIVNSKGSSDPILLAQGYEPGYAAGKIAFAKTNTRQPPVVSLFMTDVTNPGAVEPIDERVYDNWNPALSPNGRQLAFISSRDGKWKIYRINMGDPRTVTPLLCEEVDDNLVKYWEPSWSPDGERIAFVIQYKNGQQDNEVTEKNGQADIWVINIRDNSCQPLTHNRENNRQIVDKRAVWSPNGEELAFVSNREGNFEIYLMNGDGSQIKRLTNTPENENHPAWAPDGNWLVFSRLMNENDDNSNNIFIMTRDGDCPLPDCTVSNHPASDIEPLWLPARP